MADALLLVRAHHDSSSVGFVSAPSVGRNRSLSAFTVVDRVGSAATAFWDADDTLVAAGEASGPLADLLMRTIDVATPPFARSTEAFWLTEWLVRAALSKPAGVEALTVDTLVALHPSASVLDVSFRDLGPDETALRCTTGLLDLATTHSWDDLRRSIVEDRLFSPLIRPALAAWFDDGSIGRWCWSEDFLRLGIAALHSSPVSAEAADLLRSTFRLLAEELTLRYPTPFAMDELLPCPLDD